MSAGRQSKQVHAGVIASVLMSSIRSSTRRSFICRSSSPRSWRRMSSGSLVRKSTRLPGLSAMVLDGGMTAPAVYIAMVMPTSPVVVLDFDGTVTQKDIGDEICDRFAPPVWRDIDAAWVRNEISLPEAQRRMWGLARAERPEALAYARHIGHLRPGLDALMEAARRAGATMWLASGGFDFYIEALLGPRLGAFERRYFNATRFIDGRIEVDFPHAELACGR